MLGEILSGLPPALLTFFKIVQTGASDLFFAQICLEMCIAIFSLKIVWTEVAGSGKCRN